MVNMFCFPGRC